MQKLGYVGVIVQFGLFSFRCEGLDVQIGLCICWVLEVCRLCVNESVASCVSWRSEVPHFSPR